MQIVLAARFAVANPSFFGISGGWVQAHPTVLALFPAP